MQVLILLRLSGSRISSSDSHPSNAPSYIFIMLFGNIMFLRDMQSLNAHERIYLTHFERMFTFLRALHPSNALSDIVVTFSGMTISSRDTQSLKAFFPIFVMLFGMFMLIAIDFKSLGKESEYIIVLFADFTVEIVAKTPAFFLLIQKT